MKAKLTESILITSIQDGTNTWVLHGEINANLKEAVELVLEANRLLSEESLKSKRFIREPFSISA